jgi:glutamate decarboxylase
MALHTRTTVSTEMHDALFASKELSVELPKFAFPEGQTLPRFAYQAIYDELLLDGNARQNLATFC